MFLGGNDTTSIAVEWTITELARHPSTMKKAQDEVRTAIRNKSRVDENDINNMKYLKLVIKESLRLHPPAPLLVPRRTTCHTKLGPYDVPSGTVMFINTWAIHRDPKMWERPEDFVPERFDDGDVDFKGKHFRFIPFGSGKRMCPGMAFGIASVEFVLANLLYWFDWKLCGDVSQIDMGETFGLTVRKTIPLRLQPVSYDVSTLSQTQTT